MNIVVNIMTEIKIMVKLVVNIKTKVRIKGKKIDDVDDKDNDTGR
jgi:hypothetical protein